MVWQYDWLLIPCRILASHRTASCLAQESHAVLILPNSNLIACLLEEGF